MGILLKINFEILELENWEIELSEFWNLELGNFEIEK
jgi:hypothetical protein